VNFLFGGCAVLGIGQLAVAVLPKQVQKLNL
jgi:hypothetical protein